MAFFCPGSSAKLKKEIDSHRHQGIQPQSQPHPSSRQQPGVHSPQVTSRHTNIMDRVHDNGPHTPISTQFFPKMIVLHDHYPFREMELAVRKGEKVEVVKKEPEWLFVRNERGKEGYVPARNCVPPAITRRSRSNSRSSIPVRSVMSGEILEGGVERSRGGVPMFSSSSAGKVRRFDSPMDSDPESFSIRRVNSPPSNILTPSSVVGETLSTENSTTNMGTKCSLSSSSGVASLMDPSSPAMTRAFSQDELKPYNEESTMFSLSQSAIEPNDTGYNKSIIEFSQTMNAVHHKHSSSDDSGTVNSTPLKDDEYASTIRNDETSSEEGGIVKMDQVSSGGNTPSMKDRPLPTPPFYDRPNESHIFDEDTPPPVPPRNASLSSSKQRRTSNSVPHSQSPPVVPDDLSPYAQPVDSIVSGPTGTSKALSILQQQSQSRQYTDTTDITLQNTGVDSPYSEVYRGPQANKRPVNVQDGRGSPVVNRRSLPRNVQSTLSPIVRQTSPLVNGSDHTPHSPQFNNEMVNDPQSKGVAKFRKFQWGVFMCMKNFQGEDENEVSVSAGEQVLVLNRDDQFWFWVFKHKTNRTEGFVPSSILREVETSSETRQTQSLRATKSPPINLPPTGRPRVHTTANLHPPSASSNRARVNSMGSSLPHPVQQRNSMNSSIEKIPFDTSIRVPGPASPPPPYAEQDPISYSNLSQPITHESHMTSQVNRSMLRTNSQSIVRNRPPTYPRSRASTSNMYPSSPLSPMVYQGHISQSAQRLTTPTDSFIRDHNSSFPCSPIATAGGTLV